MDLFIFNKNFELLGIIDSFSSLIWRREFNKVATFELHLTLPDDEIEAANIVSLLMKDRIIVKEDSPEEAVCIETLRIDDSESETLVITGNSIENFISERFVWGEQSINGSVEEAFKFFVSNNCITPANPNRIIPNLVVSQNTGIEIQVNEINSYGTLVDLIEELALKYNVGWRILFDLLNRQYIFDVYTGQDLSVNQTVNPQAVFALEYENVLQQTFTDSNSGYKNMVLVAGQGEGISRKLVTIGDDISGFERREAFVDAKDLTTQTENGVNLTDEQYEVALTERGNSKLAESKVIQTYEAGLAVTSNLVYKKDFNLGDIVTIKNDRWGLVLNTRIITVEEVYENDTTDIRVNFGSNIPTLIDKIQQRLR